jgi:hypothetical protein
LTALQISGMIELGASSTDGFQKHRHRGGRRQPFSLRQVGKQYAHDRYMAVGQIPVTRSRSGIWMEQTGRGERNAAVNRSIVDYCGCGSDAFNLSLLV